MRRCEIRALVQEVLIYSEHRQISLNKFYSLISQTHAYRSEKLLGAIFDLREILNVLEYQKGSKFDRGPNWTYSTIWKNKLSGQKNSRIPYSE